MERLIAVCVTQGYPLSSFFTINFANKTKYLIFGGSKIILNFAVTFEEESIGRELKFIFLGLVFNKDRSFYDHVDHAGDFHVFQQCGESTLQM